MAANSSNELVVVDKRHSVTQSEPSDIETSIYAAAKRGDLALVEKLMDLKDRHEATEARKAFNVAFAAFKGEAIKILRTKEYTDGPLKGKKHAELGAIVAAVTPALSKYGLSLAWRVSKDEPVWIEVTCTLRHVDGHTESVSMGGAPDTGPGRSAMTARGSTKTYLERYTSTGILGLAPEDEDDDGGSNVNNSWISERVEWIENCRNPEELTKIFAAAFKEAQKNKDGKAMLILVEAKDRRKGEFQ